MSHFKLLSTTEKMYSTRNYSKLTLHAKNAVQYDQAQARVRTRDHCIFQLFSFKIIRPIFRLLAPILLVQF